jgi:hypothetical protein
VDRVQIEKASAANDIVLRRVIGYGDVFYVEDSGTSSLSRGKRVRVIPFDKDEAK